MEALDNNDDLRNDFVKACLQKLGLKVIQQKNAVPPLSCLHLSSLRSGEISRLLVGLKDIITIGGGEEYVKDENDVFGLEKPSTLSTSGLKESLPGLPEQNSAEKGSPADEEDRILDYSTVVKRIITHTEGYPKGTDTPYFNHEVYFEHLEDYQSNERDADPSFGQTLLYGEVVTSTNTLLEKYVSSAPFYPSGQTIVPNCFQNLIIELQNDPNL